MFDTIKKALVKAKEKLEDDGLGVLGAIGVLLGVVLVLGVAFGILSVIVWIAWMLWNGVLCDVFPAVPEVTFWQMWGLYLLSNILFKSSISNNKSE